MKNIFLIFLCTTYSAFITSAEQAEQKLKQEPGAEDQLNLKKITQYTAHAERVKTLQWHPNQLLLASGSEPFLKVGADDAENYIALCISNTNTHEQTKISLNRNISTLSWITQLGLIVGSPEDSPVEILDVNGNSLKKSNNHQYETAYSVSSHPQEQKAALASVGSIAIGIWDIATDQYQVLPITDDDNPSITVAYDLEGKLLASGDMDGYVKLWDPPSNNCIQTFTTNGAYASVVTWNPSGTLLAGTTGKNIYLWDTRTHNLLQKLSIVAFVNTLCWAPDGSYIVSGSSDGVVRLWNPDSGRCLAGSLVLNHGSVNSLDWSKVTNQLAVGDGEGNVSILALSKGSTDEFYGQGEGEAPA